ncbi:hypothetical protein AHAS_Ahas19G0193500 [Arachis hypogaea]
MQHCAASGQWLNERIALSRYAHVPLGNFELDWLIFTADTFFSRALRDSQQVLIVKTCFLDEVHVAAQNQQRIPFGVGMASDPMALRRGAKQLAMEDVCYYQWPLPGLDQFGLFGICDGAAKSASKLVFKF